MSKVVLAKAVLGKEFVYHSLSVHSVSARSAEKIRDILNDCKYMLLPGETWHIYEYDPYSSMAIFAETQKFYIRNGIVKRTYYSG